MKHITNPKRIHTKSRLHVVTPLSETAFAVTSGTSGNTYTVTLRADRPGATCTCEWGLWRPWTDPRSACSHVQAVMQHLAAQEGRTTSAWGDLDAAQRQRRPVVEIGDGVVLTSRTG